MPFDERMLRALEGRNDGIKIEVPDYAGNIKPEELIDWLNSMKKFFEWNPMIEERKVKFACTKLKVIPWYGGMMYKKIKQKRKRQNQNLEKDG